MDSFLTAWVAIDRALWNNYKVDYGNEFHSSAMETRIGVHRNLYYGCQPSHWKVLQPFGKVQLSCHKKELKMEQALNNNTSNFILLSAGLLGFSTEKWLFFSRRIIGCNKAGTSFIFSKKKMSLNCQNYVYSMQVIPLICRL